MRSPKPGGCGQQHLLRTACDPMLAPKLGISRAEQPQEVQLGAGAALAADRVLGRAATPRSSMHKIAKQGRMSQPCCGGAVVPTIRTDEAPSYYTNRLYSRFWRSYLLYDPRCAHGLHKGIHSAWDLSFLSTVVHCFHQQKGVAYVAYLSVAIATVRAWPAAIQRKRTCWLPSPYHCCHWRNNHGNVTKARMRAAWFYRYKQYNAGEVHSLRCFTVPLLQTPPPLLLLLQLQRIRKVSVLLFRATRAVGGHHNGGGVENAPPPRTWVPLATAVRRCPPRDGWAKGKTSSILFGFVLVQLHSGHFSSLEFSSFQFHALHFSSIQVKSNNPMHQPCRAVRWSVTPTGCRALPQRPATLAFC